MLFKRKTILSHLRSHKRNQMQTGTGFISDGIKSVNIYKDRIMVINSYNHIGTFKVSEFSNKEIDRLLEFVENK